MPKEKQVASLEPSQKLKELGYPQESLFYWFPVYSHETKDITETWKLIIKGQEIMGSEVISAPTVAELGEMLPINTSTTKGGYYWHCQWWDGVQDIMRSDKTTKFHRIPADTEADARAKMLIYLLENKLIEL